MVQNVYGREWKFSWKLIVERENSCFCIEVVRLFLSTILNLSGGRLLWTKHRKVIHTCVQQWHHWRAVTFQQNGIINSGNKPSCLRQRMEKLGHPTHILPTKRCKDPGDPEIHVSCAVSQSYWKWLKLESLQNEIKYEKLSWRSQDTQPDWRFSF